MTESTDVLKREHVAAENFFLKSLMTLRKER